MSPRPTDGDPQQLRAQLDLFARDMRDAFQRERQTARELESALAHLETYAGDLRKTLAQERSRSCELEEAYRETLVCLLRASGFRDGETAAHSARLARFSRILADALGLPEDEVGLVERAAPMHDIGKVGIPDAILGKPSALNPEEWERMKQHTVIGARVLRGSSSRLVETARIVALTHHECWDGSGYPQGLAGDAIPLAARIVKLADVYDTARAQRCFKPARSHEEARALILEGERGILPQHFDPQILAAFRVHEAEFASTFRDLGDAEE